MTQNHFYLPYMGFLLLFMSAPMPAQITLPSQTSQSSANKSQFDKSILPVEQAFQTNLIEDKGSEVQIQIIAAPGTYLYRDKFKLLSKGIKLSRLDIPRGERKDDPFFGPSEILRNEVLIKAKLKSGQNLHPLVFEYQGCADAGICYPPQQIKLSSLNNSFSSSKKNEVTASMRVTQLSALNTEVNKHKGKPILLDFYADWCLPCKQMEKTTFVDARVQKTLKDFVILKLDVTKNKEGEKALLKHFDVPAPPAFVFINPEGKEVKSAKWVGYASAEDLLLQLSLVKPQ